MIKKISKKTAILIALLALSFVLLLSFVKNSNVFQSLLIGNKVNQREIKSLINSSPSGYEKYLSKNKTKQEDNKINQKEEDTEKTINNSGEFFAKISADSNKFSLNQEIEVLVTGQTENIDVTAFDIIFYYQRESFDLVSVTEFTKDFSLTKIEKGDNLIFSGVEKPGANINSPFLDEKIVSLRLKPKKKGVFQLGIISSLEREKTQFVDNQSKIYYPKTNQISIEIY